jgi:hypothetical protein
LLQNSAVETRRAFGLLFVAVSIAVGSASILGEIAYLTTNFPFYYYAILWLISFGAVFAVFSARLRRAVPAILGRMKTSTRWPASAKALNGVCWAGPFIAIGGFPSLYQYLILAGIGLGNLSTYFMIKKYSGADNREQLVVAIISLAAVPIAFTIDNMLFMTHQDIALMLSRIFIGLAYGAGGAFALLTKAGPVGFDPTTSGSLH